MVLDILLLKSCSWVDKLSSPLLTQIPLEKNPQRLVILEFSNFESINKFFLWSCLYLRTEETKEAERFCQTREGQKSHERDRKNPVSQAFSCYEKLCKHDTWSEQTLTQPLVVTNLECRCNLPCLPTQRSCQCTFSESLSKWQQEATSRGSSLLFLNCKFK